MHSPSFHSEIGQQYDLTILEGSGQAIFSISLSSQNILTCDVENLQYNGPFLLTIAIFVH